MTAPFVITRVMPDDLDALMALENECFSDPWSRASMAQTLEIPVARAVAARREGKVLGFAIAYLIPPEGEVADLCVAPQERGQGIGEALLHALIDDSCCTEFWLEVRASNLPARRLYEKLGFSVVGVRSNYYENPREDALVMRLDRPEAEG